MFCSRCGADNKDNLDRCSVCGKSMPFESDHGSLTHKQKIINDEKTRESVRQNEKNKRKLGCSIPAVFIMMMVSFLILFVVPGQTSFGGWMFVIITLCCVYSVFKTMTS